MIAKIHRALSERSVVDCSQVNFSDDDDQKRMKTEHADSAVATVSHWLTLIVSTDRVAGVLQQRKALAIHQFSDQLHGATSGAEMRRN